jgi:hypothetical protein
MAKIKVYRAEDIEPTGRMPRTKRPGAWFTQSKEKARVYAKQNNTLIKSMEVDVDELFDAKKRALTYHHSKKVDDPHAFRDHSFRLQGKEKSALRSLRNQVDLHRIDVKAGKPMSKQVINEGLFTNLSRAKTDWVETAKISPKFVATKVAQPVVAGAGFVGVALGIKEMADVHSEIKQKQESRYGEGKTLLELLGIMK